MAAVLLVEVHLIRITQNPRIVEGERESIIRIAHAETRTRDAVAAKDHIAVPIVAVVREMRVVREREEARMLCNLGAVDLKASHEPLVRADRTLVKAAHAHLATRTELFGGDDVILRILCVQTHGSDPVALCTHLIVRPCPQEGELAVRARRDLLIGCPVSAHVRRKPDVIGEYRVRLALAVQIGDRGEHDAIVRRVVEPASDKVIAEIALRAAIPKAEIEDILVPRGVGEEPLVMQVGVRALAADVHVKEAACARVIVVDVGAAVADADGYGTVPLRHELPIGERTDLHVAEMPRRGDECRTKGVRTSRDVRVEIGECGAPVARVVRSRVADGEADMVALLRLYFDRDTVGTCTCRGELRAKDECARVVDALDLLRELADVHGVARELGQQSTNGRLARLFRPLNDDGAHAHIHVLHVHSLCMLLCCVADITLRAVDRTGRTAAVVVCGCRRCLRDREQCSACEDRRRQNPCLFFLHTLYRPFGNTMPSPLHPRNHPVIVLPCASPQFLISCGVPSYHTLNHC